MDKPCRKVWKKRRKRKKPYKMNINRWIESRIKKYSLRKKSEEFKSVWIKEGISDNKI